MVRITYLGQSTFRFTTAEPRLSSSIHGSSATRCALRARRKSGRSTSCSSLTAMRLISTVHQPHLALLRIGDHHTMGPVEAAEATRLLGVEEVVPMHYGVTPGSEDAPATYREALDAAGLGAVRTFVMTPGQTASWDRATGIRA
jgi:hypothetical protein